MSSFRWHKSKGEGSKAVAVVDDPELFSTKGKYGLSFLSDPPNAIVDIVFVHGLTGNRETTWTHQNGTFWPRDLLRADIDTARIATWGYDADVVRALSNASSNTLRDHGKSLLIDLAQWKSETDTEKRPLLFVAHSLGGLVVEQCLLVSRGSAEKHEKAVLESTEYIAFMGTPHAGSDQADRFILDAVTKLSALMASTNKQILHVLRRESEVLANQQGDFHNMLTDRLLNAGRYMKLFCFYEESEYKKIGKIVSDQSAILTAYGSASIPADHVGMTKFEAADDPGYVRIRGRIRIWVKELTAALNQSGTPALPSKREDTTRTDEGVSLPSPRLIDFNGDATAHGGSVYQGTYTAANDMHFSHGRQT